MVVGDWTRCGLPPNRLTTSQASTKNQLGNSLLKFRHWSYYRRAHNEVYKFKRRLTLHRAAPLASQLSPKGLAVIPGSVSSDVGSCVPKDPRCLSWHAYSRSLKRQSAVYFQLGHKVLSIHQDECNCTCLLHLTRGDSWWWGHQRFL